MILILFFFSSSFTHKLKEWIFGINKFIEFNKSLYYKIKNIFKTFEPKEGKKF